MNNQQIVVVETNKGVFLSQVVIKAESVRWGRVVHSTNHRRTRLLPVEGSMQQLNFRASTAVSRCRPTNKQHVKRICIFLWEAYEPSLKMAHIPFIYMPLAGAWSHTRGLGNLEQQNIKGENLKQLASYFLPPCPPFLAPCHPVLGYHFFVLGYHFQSPYMDFKEC